MNNLTFGMEGPIMEGTWYNTQTGDSFTVRNSFFEDNQYIVQTTDGRILRYDQIQNYIKSDKPIEMAKPKQTQINDALPAEVADLIGDFEGDMLPEDMEMINGYNSLGNLASPTIHAPEIKANAVVVNQSVSTNYNIISKALTKRSLPDFQVLIDWNACPLKEMNMLMDLMDVEESEIIDWYLSQVDVENTTYMIKEVIKDFISKQLHPSIVETVAVTSERVEMIPQSQDMDTVATIEKPESIKKTTKKTTKKK